MAWITLTEDDVITKLSGPETAAMKTAALQAAQVDPLPEVIEQVVLEVRGRVSACAANTLGAAGTIPDELKGAAINRIRYELATRLPVASLLTDARIRANDQAIALLRDVGSCDFAIVPPENPAPETEQPGSGTPRICRPRRQFTDRRQDGS